MKNKLIIFSAPSGAGKTTIINHLLQCELGLEFSISATSRPPRGNEKNGIEYYFLSTEEFKDKIRNNEFIEYEEVYQGCFYGTLRSEIERISAKGNIVIFDVDIQGGINLKRQFGDNALSIFLAPPSINELRNRLKKRSTDSAEMIDKRVEKAAYEITFGTQFDVVIMNDDLPMTKQEAEKVIRHFIENNLREKHN